MAILLKGMNLPVDEVAPDKGVRVAYVAGLFYFKVKYKHTCQEYQKNISILNCLFCSFVAVNATAIP